MYINKSRLTIYVL